MQLAVIRLCKFAVIRENLSIFAVIKKNVAAITPLGDFDMRPIFLKFDKKPFLDFEKMVY